jgi:hypothetical protein
VIPGSPDQHGFSVLFLAKLTIGLISKITQETRIDRRFSAILFFAFGKYRTTPHSLSYVLANFHVDPCSLEASARSQRGGMRCCARRVPISEIFPIRFLISEIRKSKIVWAFRFFVNQTGILELISRIHNLQEKGR